MLGKNKKDWGTMSFFRTEKGELQQGERRIEH